jgi:purine-nucleoside phosphorylase
MTSTYDMIQQAVEKIHTYSRMQPAYAIILGTGLSRLKDSIDIEATIPYEDIPFFPESTLETHAGELLIGTLCGKNVVAMHGRFHRYEGYSLQQVVFPVRVMKFLGAHTLFVSNACGGLNPNFPPGSLMLIEDHINLLSDSPLIGPNDNRIGVRYPDMCEPYTKTLLDLAMQCAQENKIRVEKGVYAAMTGPNLETRAEYRMLRLLGADVIGMSTVPEVIAAVHCAMNVLGISVVTDSCLPDALEPADIDTIIATANKAEPKMVTLIEKVCAAL